MKSILVFVFSNPLYKRIKLNFQGPTYYLLINQKQLEYAVKCGKAKGFTGLRQHIQK